jgi:hypothetical protein
MSRFRLTLAAALALAAVPVIAADTAKDNAKKDNSREIATAAAHAGMAAGAESPQMVKSHLQHVINCLEGPKGADFAAALGNPCGSEGMGAIPDSKEDGKKKLEDTAALAKRAMAELDVDKAKLMAAQIQTELAK